MRILTVDVEDWFHILDNPATNGEKNWLKFQSRVEDQTLRLLDLFQTYDRIGTFFILGYIARKFPDLVKEISNRGHQIATHGDMHQLVFNQSKYEFEADLVTSIEAIESASGVLPNTYRAPGFSVTKQCDWAFDILYKNGVRVDASIFPSKRAHGGMPSFPFDRPCNIITRGDSKLRIFPLNTHSFLGKDFVFSGGGYFRLSLLVLLNKLFGEADYLMTYFHPRDFDPDQPSIPGLTASRRFKSYVGLKSSFSKLEIIIEKYNFESIGSAEAKINWDDVPNVEL